MPELPEVETIVNQLRPVISGRIIQKVKIMWKRSIQGDENIFKELLSNRITTTITRRGKYICFHFPEGFHLTIHLGMTGKLMFHLNETDKQYVRVRFFFKEGAPLYFIDMRKFGKLKIWPASEPLLPRLGPEPLSQSNISQAFTSVNTSRAAKTVLLDQRVLAGIGNIYADEALFKAGINPLTPFNRITPTKVKILSGVIPQILRQAIQNNGTTIINYRSPDQLKGRNQYFLKVYGNSGRACQNCGTVIEKIKINGRGSHFCPRCQSE
jgi:formamidopyrimidine-DNA glycosylase